MTKPIIEIKGLGKKYKIGALREPYLSLRDSLARKAKGFAQSISRLTANSSELTAHSSQEDFWALKDVNFSVQQGEAVGIIGRNGAGKSTLLKILSQITPPTEGEITCRGRIASLLEVGTGFHPELTGRENIYLNGAILGMTRGEIRSKFDEIVAFAEVEKFLDTPVKRYSSGMYVRLAFAVAAHLEPEILVVDEVLAVGDAQFQAKCLGKMGEVAKGGRTVLFVSHNMAAVSQLCSSGVAIKQGKIDFTGTSEDTIRHYIQKTCQKQGSVCLHDIETVIAANLPARILSVHLTDGDGEPCQTFFIGDKLNLNITCYFNHQYNSVRLSFMVKSISKGCIYHCVTLDAGFLPVDISGEVTFTATFPCLELYPDSYLVDALRIASQDGELLDSGIDVVSFQVAPGGHRLQRSPATHAAVVHVVPEWSILR